MAQYNNFTYLYPPRPEKAIPDSLLGYYEKRGYVGQYKKNGTANVIFVSPDKKIFCMNRHNEDHKAWSPNPKTLEPFLSFPGNGWYVFCAELLNNKFAGVRDTQYIFDILVNDGEYLLEQTFLERFKKIEELFNVATLKSSNSEYIVQDNIWVAKTLHNNFKDTWKQINSAVKPNKAPENEGLVLKSPTIVLRNCAHQNSNSNSMVKCRISHKNYSF